MADFKSVISIYTKSWIVYGCGIEYIDIAIKFEDVNAMMCQPLRFF